MAIQDHQDQLPMLISMLGHYQIIFEITRLQLPNVVILVALHTAEFG
jgi:hypothetical protein